MECRLFSCLMFVTLILSPVHASALTLEISSGRLMGINDVAVGATLYDVQFMDGYAEDIYSFNPDGTPKNTPDSYEASAALLSVFNEDFYYSSHPDEINGFSLPFSQITKILTPYKIDYSYYLDQIAVRTYGIEVLGYWAALIDKDILLSDPLDDGALTWAVWTAAAPAPAPAPVPEPSTLLLLGSGLIGLIVSFPVK